MVSGIATGDLSTDATHHPGRANIQARSHDAQKGRRTLKPQAEKADAASSLLQPWRWGSYLGHHRGNLGGAGPHLLLAGLGESMPARAGEPPGEERTCRGPLGGKRGAAKTGQVSPGGDSPGVTARVSPPCPMASLTGGPGGRADQWVKSRESTFESLHKTC